MAEAKSLMDLQPLVGSILTTNCEVLNAANPEVLSLVLASGADAALRSDCDEQLLLTVPFQTPVKLHTLQFAAQEGFPQTLKLYVNRMSMTFDDVESFPPTQVLKISAADVKDGVATIPLQFVKFQCVQSLAIFVADNLDGSDVTQLSRVHFFGMPIALTNVNDLKKQG